MAQYLSYDGLRKYDELLKAWHNKDHEELVAKINEIAGGSDAEVSLAELKSDLEALSAAHDTDIEALRDLISEVTGANSDSLASMSEMNARLEAAEAAVEALNGTGENSVEAKAQAAAEAAVAVIVDGAPEAFDTLKEVAEWIKNEDSEVVGIIDSIADANTAAANAQDAADAAAAKAEANETAIAGASAAIENVNSRIDELEALLGAEGSESEGDSLLDRVGALEANHTADVTNIYNAISEIKQESDTAIPDSDIEALFA